MEMTDEEIRRSYRLAKNKEKQIIILSQLNLCSKNKIRKILGLKTISTRKEWTEKELKTALILRENGYTYEKIGKELGRTTSSVSIKLLTFYRKHGKI